MPLNLISFKNIKVKYPLATGLFSSPDAPKLLPYLDSVVVVWNPSNRDDGLRENRDINNGNE